MTKAIETKAMELVDAVSEAHARQDAFRAKVSEYESLKRQYLAILHELEHWPKEEVQIDSGSGCETCSKKKSCKAYTNWYPGVGCPKYF